MLIHRMNAHFGNIRDGALNLHAGLNILQVSDQTEASDWFDFFRVIFYGLPASDSVSVPPPDGVSDARPDSSAADTLPGPDSVPVPVDTVSASIPVDTVSSSIPVDTVSTDTPASLPYGHILCQTADRELTLSRSTPRPDAPMTDFHAEGSLPDGLTAHTCGEMLLGLPRESFDRAAVLRPSDFPPEPPHRESSPPIPSDSATRIPSESANRIPSESANRISSESVTRIPSDGARFPHIPPQIVPNERRNLESQLVKTEKRLRTLQDREKTLDQEKDAWERREAEKNNLANAQKAFASMEDYAAALRRELDERHVPELDVIGRLRGAIVNLRSARKLVQRAEDEQKDAEWILQAAEDSANRTIFAGKPPEEAAQMPIHLPPEPIVPLWLEVALIVCAIALVPLVILSPSPVFTVLDLVFVLFALVTVWVIRQRKSSWDALALRREKRRKADLERYFRLYHDMEEARAEAIIRESATESLRSTLRTNEDGILREVRRFAPGVTDLAGADEQLRDAARRRKELSAIESGRYRESDDTAGRRSRDDIRHDLTLVREELSAVRNAQKRMSERLDAMKSIPLFVCDALGALDDAQCAAVLDELRALSEERQILLFTTHTREAEYLTPSDNAQTMPDNEEPPSTQTQTIPDNT